MAKNTVNHNGKFSHFVHRVTYSVHYDRGTGHMLGWVSALHHGPVLNHPLIRGLTLLLSRQYFYITLS